MYANDCGIIKESEGSFCGPYVIGGPPYGYVECDNK